MNEQDCLKFLLDSSHPIREKDEYLSEYISYTVAVARNMGLGIHAGRKFAFESLLKSLDAKGKQKFKKILDKISEFRMQQSAKNRKSEVKIAANIRSLTPGTNIVIKNENREDIVRFLEMRRSHFVCEYPDGRRYRVPVSLFVKVHKGRALKHVSEKERNQRSLIRALGGKQFPLAYREILKDGDKNINILLDELAATIERIENAPVGFSAGVLSSSLGPVKKINPRDQALVKRIPQVIGEIAVSVGKGKVSRKIEKYPNDEVKNYCKKVIDKM